MESWLVPLTLKEVIGISVSTIFKDFKPCLVNTIKSCSLNLHDILGVLLVCFIINAKAHQPLFPFNILHDKCEIIPENEIAAVSSNIMYSLSICRKVQPSK